MKTLFLLFLFCHVSSPVKHTLKFFFTASSGVPNFPELVATIVVDEILAGYCDTNTKTIKPKQDWMEKVFEDDPQHLEHYNRHCSENDPVFFKTLMDSLKQSFNHSGGIHILQRMNGCEWDDETGEVNVFVQYGYDGDFFLVFDVKTETWIASKPQAITTKQIWDKDKDRITDFKKYLTQIFPGWLKKYVAYGNSTLLRKGKRTHMYAHRHVDVVVHIVLLVSNYFRDQQASTFPQCLSSRRLPPLQSAATLQVSTLTEPPCSGGKMERTFMRTWTSERSSPTTMDPSR
ncbi:major histocompatibility complex class I-related gene protein-like isoform X2 [Micropterus dolomieu]|uniref:major histocompatibility complex class I-related gene protein-like isoform X2 n=1 Tax=Micropterus dolomieu TaxID=147949 RepID=UPI001E8CFFF2|nr:major histocompatibility complex class I-related gene protein-like isoform X2 [Micropterus dolomieu]